MVVELVPGPRSNLTIAEYVGQLISRTVPELIWVYVHADPLKQGPVLSKNWKPLFEPVNRKRANLEAPEASKYSPSQFLLVPNSVSNCPIVGLLKVTVLTCPGVTDADPAKVNQISGDPFES